MTLTDNFLDGQRQLGDNEADQLINTFFTKGLNKQVYEMLALPDAEIVSRTPSNAIHLFLISQRPEPELFSTKKIDAGQRVFKKYALDIMTLLGVLSLPYCYAASPGNKALYLTAKMRKATGKRLVETADFIINVLSPTTLSNTGTGHIQINKVRLTHALVRYYLQQGEWDLAWGLPINQEDMAGTNLAFSYIILTGLARIGYVLTEQEREDFLYVWRYVGYQMHLTNELLPQNMAEAQWLENKIKRRHFKSSVEGTTLTTELLNHYKSYFPTVPAYFVDAQMRYLLGSNLSALLGLQPEPVKDELLKSLNAVAETANKFYVKPSSFEKMLDNHAKLKKQFLLG